MHHPQMGRVRPIVQLVVRESLPVRHRMCSSPDGVSDLKTEDSTAAPPIMVNKTYSTRASSPFRVHRGGSRDQRSAPSHSSVPASTLLLPRPFCYRGAVSQLRWRKRDDRRHRLLQFRRHWRSQARWSSVGLLALANFLAVPDVCCPASHPKSISAAAQPDETADVRLGLVL